MKRTRATPPDAPVSPPGGSARPGCGPAPKRLRFLLLVPALLAAGSVRAAGHAGAPPVVLPNLPLFVDCDFSFGPLPELAPFRIDTPLLMDSAVPLADYQLAVARGARWSLDPSFARPAIAPPYQFSGPLYGELLLPRRVFAYRLATDGWVQPYIGIGLGPRNEGGYAVSEYESGENEIVDFAHSLVGGVEISADERWTMKVEGDFSSVGVGFKYCFD